MRIVKLLISGASGLIGKALVKSLIQEGHHVFTLNRHSNQTTPYWDIDKKIIALGNNTQYDGIIHLAGENIAQGRWSTDKKDRILQSRVKSTTLLAEYFSKTAHRPQVFISGSAIGIYGNRGDEVLNEKSSYGTGFLSDVCKQWEQTTQVATQAGIRVVNIRLGMVLSRNGGALGKMILPFKMGLGGVIGSGKQYISWITVNDVVGIIHHILNNEEIKGPINLVSPEPATNYQFTKKLGDALHRPSVLPFPAFMAKLLFGEMADSLLLTSTKVYPEKLLQSGYRFEDETLDSAFARLFSGNNQN